MNEKNKEKKVDAPLTKEGAAFVQTPGWKRWFSRKWVFPAIYMAVAAIIVTLMWIYQDSQREVLNDKELGLNPAEEQQIVPGDESVAVTGETENMQWPFKEETGALEVMTPFYDSEASNESKQAAIVQHENSLMPHSGMDFAREDGETFEVVAALSGTVSRVENLPLIGNVIEITHDNQIKTVYQSVNDVKVTAGQKVEQGQTIAMAGRNEMEKDLGVHLHFEVYENGQAVNPEQFIQTP